MSPDEAGEAVRALLGQLGPDAVEQLAQAQARVAWAEVTAAAGLQRGTLGSRLLAVRDGVARVEASEAILAQELRLRADALVWALNRQMRGRPGATIEVRRLAISVGPWRGSSDL